MDNLKFITINTSYTFNLLVIGTKLISFLNNTASKKQPDHLRQRAELCFGFC